MKYNIRLSNIRSTACVTSCCPDVFFNRCIFVLHVQISMEVGMGQSWYEQVTWLLKWDNQLWVIYICPPLVLMKQAQVASSMRWPPKPPIAAVVRLRHSMAYLTCVKELKPFKHTLFCPGNWMLTYLPIGKEVWQPEPPNGIVSQSVPQSINKLCHGELQRVIAEAWIKQVKY